MPKRWRGDVRKVVSGVIWIHWVTGSLKYISTRVAKSFGCYEICGCQPNLLTSRRDRMRRNCLSAEVEAFPMAMLIVFGPFSRRGKCFGPSDSFITGATGDQPESTKTNCTLTSISNADLTFVIKLPLYYFIFSRAVISIFFPN